MKGKKDVRKESVTSFPFIFFDHFNQDLSIRITFVKLARPHPRSTPGSIRQGSITLGSEDQRNFTAHYDIHSQGAAVILNEWRSKNKGALSACRHPLVTGQLFPLLR